MPNAHDVHPTVLTQMEKFSASLRDPNIQLQLFLRADSMMLESDGMKLGFTLPADANNHHKRAHAENFLGGFNPKRDQFNFDGERGKTEYIIVSTALWERMKSALVESNKVKFVTKISEDKDRQLPF